jgi:putative peptidoglycan lipid II flippase
MKEMLLIALPVIMGTAVNEINVLVNRTLASRIAEGGISALNYANRLNGFVQGLFVMSVTTVLYPMISKMAAEGNLKSLKAYLAEAISMVGLLVIPAMVGAMIFAREIVAFLFGRGAFTEEAVTMTGSALFCYSLGLIAFGLRDVLTRAFYSLQDTRTPMINATIAVSTNILLNVILSRFLGIRGLALATSISGIISALLMFITLRTKIGSFGLKRITQSFVKISGASVLMGAIASGSYRFLCGVVNHDMALVVAIAVGALTYGIVIAFMGIPEVDRALKSITQRVVKRSGRKTGTSRR